MPKCKRVFYISNRPLHQVRARQEVGHVFNRAMMATVTWLISRGPVTHAQAGREIESKREPKNKKKNKNERKVISIRS